MKAARTLRTERAVLAPYSVWALLFVLVPLIFVAYYAFTDNSFAFTTEHITRFFTATSSLVQDDGSTTEVHTYLLIFVRSLKLAVISPRVGSLPPLSMTAISLAISPRFTTPEGL